MPDFAGDGFQQVLRCWLLRGLAREEASPGQQLSGVVIDRTVADNHLLLQRPGAIDRFGPTLLGPARRHPGKVAALRLPLLLLLPARLVSHVDIRLRQPLLGKQFAQAVHLAVEGVTYAGCGR